MKGTPPKTKTAAERHVEQKSDKLSPSDAAIVVLLASMGFQHKRIAALFDVNQGRIAEIVRGVSNTITLEREP